MHALQSYRSLQPILQTATDATEAFNKRFNHLVQSATQLIPTSTKPPELLALVQNLAPLLPMFPPAAPAAPATPSCGAVIGTCTSSAPTADASETEAAQATSGYNTCGSDAAPAPATCGYNTCGSERDDAA